MILGFIIALTALLIDQLSKWFVQGLFEHTTNSIGFGNFFNLVEAWNTGVSFSMFNDKGPIGVIILSTFAIGVIVFLCFWLRKEKNKAVQISLGLIIGGALGNVVDRIRFGAVYDFLDFYYKTWHWPAFNMADTFICVGAFIIIIHSVIYPNHNLKKES